VDVPHTPILGLDEVLEDPQARHMGIAQEMVHPTKGMLRTIRTPVILDRQRGGADISAPPTLNEHRPPIRAALARGAASGKK